MKITAYPLVDGLIIALLFLAMFQLPMTAAVNGHDSGSQAAYEYWTLHGFAYGRDIFQNVGPLGFLSYPGIYTGFLSETKLLINLVLICSLIFLLLNSSKSLPVDRRIIFLIFAGVFAVGSVALFLLLLLLSQQLMFARRRRVALPAMLLLALLALAHGTYLFIVLFSVTASIVSYILSRRFVFAVTTAMGFIICLFTIWALAGQSFADFPAFLYGMATFTSGYNEAMALYESSGVRAAGFIALLGSTLLIAWRVLKSIRVKRLDAPQIGSQLLLSATEFVILFVVWKYGFVRADGHVTYFFHYILICLVGSLFAGEFPDGSTPNTPLVLSTPFLHKYQRSVLYQVARIAVLIIAAGVLLSKYSKIESTLVGIINGPHHFAKLDIELKENIAKMQFPKTRGLVGQDSISYFGNFLAPMLYNGLNYVSTPSTVSFASWNDRIINADAMFFRDEQRAPTYLFFSLDTTDGRLVAQDSSLAQLEILHRYEVRSFEVDRLGLDYPLHRGKLLLCRINNREPLSKAPISAKEIHVGDWVNVPQDSSNPIWVKVEVSRGLIAPLVALAYKPPQYRIEMVFKNGIQRTYKFVSQMAATGFLINPLILENNDALAVRFRQEYQRYLNDTHPILSKVVKFRITCDKLVALCGQVANVAFEEVHGLTLGYEDDQAKFYRLRAGQFDFDAEVMATEVASPVISTTAFGEDYFQFDAPSRIKIHKPRGEQQLKAFYGMYPGTYEKGAHPFYSQIYKLKVGLDWLQSKPLASVGGTAPIGGLDGVEIGVTAYERGSQHVRSEIGTLKIELDWALKKSAIKLYSGTLSGAGADGVELVVRMETVEGQHMLVFKRDFNPIEVPGDRGEQLLDIALPSDEGTLFIEVNSKNNSIYDQFLMRKLSIEKPRS